MDRKAALLKSVRHWPKKRGKSFYLKFLQGEKLTPMAAIAAHCYSCEGGESTGEPCSVDTCALRPLHPYRLNVPDNEVDTPDEP